MPRVSVVLCAYKSQERIIPTIESILGQTFEDFELIIIDDASGDNTPEIIGQVADPRARLIVNETNLGVAASRNKGVGLARGAYVAHCDHDDIWKPDKLRRQVDFMESHPGCGLLGTEMEVYLNGSCIEVTSVPRYSSPYLKWLLFLQSVFLHSSTMMRRSVLMENRIAYSPDLSFADDWCIYHQIAKVSDLGMIDTPLVEYHLHDRNWSRVAKKQMQDRGGTFFGRELSELLGRPVAKELVRSYLDTVVEGEGCRDAAVARAVGGLLSEIYAAFARSETGPREDIEQIRADTANKWRSILMASARRFGPQILRLYGEEGLPGWRRIGTCASLMAYVESTLKCVLYKARTAVAR